MVTLLMVDGNILPQHAQVSAVEQHNSHHHSYPCGAFEGIIGCPDARNPGTVNILALAEHVDRLFRSMEAIGLYRKPERDPCIEPPPEQYCAPPIDTNKILTCTFSPDEVETQIISLAEEGLGRGYFDGTQRLYFRPLAFRGASKRGDLGVFSLNHPVVLEISVREWGQYIEGGDKVIEHGASMLALKQGTDNMGRTNKLCTNYDEGQRWKNHAMCHGFHEALLTSTTPAQEILEGTGENLVVQFKDGTFATPDPKNKPILPGITLDICIQILELTGHSVQRCNIPLERVLANEIHGGDKIVTAMGMTGTAAEFTPIGFIQDETTGKSKRLEIPDVFRQLRQQYLDLVQNKEVDPRLQDLQERVLTPISIPVAV